MNIKKLNKGRKSTYPEHVISTVCQELLSGRLSYTEACRKYEIKSDSTIRVWIANYQKQYGSNLVIMEQNKDADKELKKEADTAELKARCEQLQAALDLARLENLALNTMIDIADEQLHTNIRKKSGAKQ